MTADNLTERQRKWFASLAAGLERDTGKSLDEWVAIARTCPETRMQPRLHWFRREHGLGQNRAIHVLDQAFGSAHSWDDPDALIEALWKDPGSRAVFEAVSRAAGGLDGVVLGARKGYTAWARTFQFAAVKPTRGGTALLGLALPPDADPRLQPAGREAWSERLKSKLALASPAEVDAGIEALLKRAWEAS